MHALLTTYSMMRKIVVKWGKETYNVDIDVSADVIQFKAQLSSLTNVPMDKQKIMGFKGGILKDDTDLSTLGIQDGMRVTLIGTPEEKQLAKPKNKIVFEEDITADQRLELFKDSQVAALPSGLTNLKNTCYMAAVLQFLRPATSLQATVANYPSSTTDDAAKVATAFKELVAEMSVSQKAVLPAKFVLTFKTANEQFNNSEQQDADEFLQALLQQLGTALKKANNNVDAVDQEFGFQIVNEYTCQEAGPDGQAEVFSDSESMKKLPVFCGNQSCPVNHMHEGLKLALEEDVKRTSNALSREAVFRKVGRVATLPKHLIVQMVRFEWKQANVFVGTEAGRSKINRKITFPLKFDMWEYITKDLKDSLAPVRDIMITRSEASTRDRMDVVEEEESPLEQVTEWRSLKADTPVATGQYELCSIVTHIGASTDSGHYIGWARKAVLEGSTSEPTPEDLWLKFDDDKVSESPYKNLQLDGGHAHVNVAYMLMYRRKMLTPTVQEISKAKRDHDVRMQTDDSAVLENVVAAGGVEKLHGKDSEIGDTKEGMSL